jgi:hypothetical protein
MKGDCGVERCLTAEGGQQGLRLLLRDHHLDKLRRDGLDIGRIGEFGISHDRRRIGVDQDHPEALVPQHAAGLSTGIVELAGLPNHNGTRADHKNGSDIGPARHYSVPPWTAIRSTNLSKR